MNKVFSYDQAPTHNIGDYYEGDYYSGTITKKTITEYKGHRIITYTYKINQGQYSGFVYIEKAAH